MLVEKDYIKELKYELLMFKDQVSKYGLLIRAFITLLRPGTAYRKLLFFVLMRDKNNQTVFFGLCVCYSCFSVELLMKGISITELLSACMKHSLS
jgi:hypothetical protein